MIDTLHTLTEIQPPRNYRNISSLNEIADYIKLRFEENGLEVSFQEYTIFGFTYKNVIGVMNPDNKRTLIVGGHYDVQGNKPGADDNASAVAGLVETSKILKDKNLDLRIEFVAFTLEEPPFFGTKKMGSYIHANSIKNRTDIIGMINYEMIGFFSDEEWSQEYPLSLKLIMKDVKFPTTGDFIAFVSNKNSEDFLNSLNIENTQKDIKTFELVIPKFIEKKTASDHLNYWKFDIPAIMITDTAYFRNKNYHKKTDSIDTLNLLKMKQVIELTAKLIEEL